MERSTTVLTIYTYPETSWSTLDLSGYSVEATDGDIGHVDNDTYEVGSGSLIVDTGPWIFGKKVMLPASVIARIDENERRIWVNLSKEQIQSAPEYDDSLLHDTAYRDELGTYYSNVPGDTANRPAGPDYGKDDRGFSS
jgi:hypothetical protein